MKKYFFYIVLVISLYSFAQQTSFSNVVTISVPEGARLMTKEQVIAYTNQNYKRSQITPDRKNIYQLDGLIISFLEFIGEPGIQKDA